MNDPSSIPPGIKVDDGLLCLCGIASFFRIATDSDFLTRELSLFDRKATEEDLIRAARLVGLKARVINDVTLERLSRIPLPAIVKAKDGGFSVFIGRTDTFGAMAAFITTSAERRPRSGRSTGHAGMKTPPVGKDREFLPAALEILETPSLVRTSFILIICAFFAIALVWA
jgi:hypothetical protein